MISVVARHISPTLRRWQVLAVVVIAAAALTGCSAKLPWEGHALSRGNPAPTFSGETFAHGGYSLAGSTGRPVLINFWFPSCPPCSAEMPDLQAAYHKYGDRIDFIGIQQIGLDTKADGIAFLEERGITYPNMADSTFTIQADYEVTGFPTTVFLDREHNISKVWTGLISKKSLEDQIEAVIKG